MHASPLHIVSALLCLPCRVTLLEAAQDAVTHRLEDYTAAGPPAEPNVRLPFRPADCFVHETWDPEKVVKVSDLQYGRAYHPYEHRNVTLRMDTYSPPASQGRSARPAVVLVHGGAFLAGDKRDMERWARLLAARGYFVAAINYRMVPLFAVFLLLSAEPAILAQEDARAAVRLLRKNARPWRIDGGRIAVGGESAGALTALYYGYVRRNRDGSAVTEGESGNPGYSSVIHAVLSMSGAMVDRAFCLRIGKQWPYMPKWCILPGPPLLGDFTGSVMEGNISSLDMHGTRDDVIPFFGAEEWDMRATAKGVIHDFIKVPGAGHTPQGQLFDPREPYLARWLGFLSGALNLAEAACPSASSEAGGPVVLI